MVTHLISLLISTALAVDSLPPSDVSKQFKEPGHIPQHIPKAKYGKLSDVIPKAHRVKTDAEKEARRKKKAKRQRGAPGESYENYTQPDPLKLDPEPTSENCQAPVPVLDFFFPSAFAMGCARTPVAPEPAVEPSKGPEPKPSPSGGVPVAGIDLRRCDSSIKYQTEPKCTAYGLAAAIENLLCLHGQEKANQTNLSEMHIFNLYNQYNVHVAMQNVPGKWITSENVWPESRKSSPPNGDYTSQAVAHWALDKTGFKYLYSDVRAFRDSLRSGNVVYLGLAVPQDMSACRATIRQTSGITDGGHAILAVGAIDDASVAGGGYFILKQSWGSSCGDHGYQYLPYAYCDKPGMYCYGWELSQAALR